MFVASTTKWQLSLLDAHSPTGGISTTEGSTMVLVLISVKKIVLVSEDAKGILVFFVLFHMPPEPPCTLLRDGI